jgi:uncharacterized protein (TIGR02147 family)
MGRTKTTQPIEITQYTDYLPYIADLIAYKREMTGFSYRVFCRKSGFKSPSYLKWVVDGVRPISLRSVHKFSQGLSLNKRESQYFTLMVNYKEAPDTATKRLYYEQMLGWQQRRSGNISKDAYEYLSHWYYVAIRELVGAADFQDDPSWIRDRLESDLTLWEIKNGLETLARLELIQRDGAGRWEQASRNLRTEHEIVSLAAYSYHIEMLDMAQKALSNRTADEREFQSLVAMVDAQTYQSVKQEVQEFLQGLVERLEHQQHQNGHTNNGVCKELYALNVQLLPLTVRRKGER